MFHQNLRKLVDKVNGFYGSGYAIELYAMDENGENVELYRGLVRELTPLQLVEFIRLPSCVYTCTVIGVPQQLINTPNIVFENIVRKEFCWLTDPVAPRVKVQLADSISVEWPPISCCGVSSDTIIAHSVIYSLTVAIGRQRSVGRFRNYLSDSTLKDEDFIQVCRGPNILSANVNDLTPNTIYHFRLKVEYMGTIIYSSIADIPTLGDVPNRPSKPRVNISFRVAPQETHINRNIQDGNVDTSRDIRIHLQWPIPEDNGSKILKYQVQVKEIISKAALPPALSSPKSPDPLLSGADSPQPRKAGNSSPFSPQSQHRKSSHNLSPGRRRSTLKQRHLDQNEEVLPDGFISSSWKTVYSHSNSEAIINGPSEGSIKMLIRIRALNSAGWSDTSVPLNLNYTTHPSLFPQGFAITNMIQHEQQRLITNPSPTISAAEMHINLSSQPLLTTSTSNHALLLPPVEAVSVNSSRVAVAHMDAVPNPSSAPAGALGNSVGRPGGLSSARQQTQSLAPAPSVPKYASVK